MPRSRSAETHRLCDDTGQSDVVIERRTRRRTCSASGRRPSVVMLVICLVLVTAVLQVDAIHWLAVAKRRNAQWNRTSECRQTTSEGLARQQRRLCSRNLDLMPAVVHSARQMAQICQETFYESRWNCSSVLLAPNFMPDLTGGSREQAFVYALTSASLTHAISKACSAGTSIRCGCGAMPRDQPDGDFRWGGCNDDVGFAAEFSRMFTDSAWTNRKKLSKRMMTNRHNYAAGRKLAVESLATACKCHGVSGSCSMRTCWKSLPDLRSVAVSLLDRYSFAVEVKYRRLSRRKSTAGLETTTSAVNTVKTLVPVLRRRRTLNDTDIAYYTMSPDYCLPDASLGSVGTKDRECQTDDESRSDSCRSMCCGRGFSSRQVEIHYRCECKYYWCCYVKCKTCSKFVQVNRCR